MLSGLRMAMVMARWCFAHRPSQLRPKRARSENENAIVTANATVIATAGSPALRPPLR